MIFNVLIPVIHFYGFLQQDLQSSRCYSPQKQHTLCQTANSTISIFVLLVFRNKSIYKCLS